MVCPLMVAMFTWYNRSEYGLVKVVLWNMVLSWYVYAQVVTEVFMWSKYYLLWVYNTTIWYAASLVDDIWCVGLGSSFREWCGILCHVQVSLHGTCKGIEWMREWKSTIGRPMLLTFLEWLNEVF